MALGANDLPPPQAADADELLATAAWALASSFASGATLWCVAPEWPEHARHVAVEFVHPVVMGKRALPAVSVDAPDPSASLRSLVAAGDWVLALGPSGSAATAGVIRRATAWGAHTAWIGAGDRPPRDAADHVLWVDRESGAARHDGSVVLVYHVFWELTHVCFEHPGLLATGNRAGCDDDETCVTCSDEGRLGDVIAADTPYTARVRTARGVELIDTTVIDEIAPGDLVLIHAGSAIAILA